MADYKLQRNGGVFHIPSGSHIPNDPANKDWRIFQEWENVPGNVADPADPPAPREPQEIDVIKRALANKGTVTPAELNSARDQLKIELNQ